MKNQLLLLSFALIFVLITVQLSAQVAVNTDGNGPDASAMLDVKSTAMGMLIPRMTMAERDAIVSPATGLILFQTDNTGGFYYNSGTPEAPLWMPVGSTSGWGTTGNGGLTTGINFLGTTDDVPLMFKVNNQLAGKIESFNTALGLNAMYANTTGSGNIAVGTGALYNNTVRGSLVAIGDSAMYGNLSGLQNTAIGSKALFSNTDGSYNTAAGYNAMKYNTIGYGNTAFGESALLSNTYGFHNTATGTSSLRNNSSGKYNTANGVVALYANTEGEANTATGAYALSSNQIGLYNTATGFRSLEFNNAGDYNTANGVESLNKNTIGYHNTASGCDALYHNTEGYGNSAMGMETMMGNTMGSNNSAFGMHALRQNSNGNNNTACGYKAIYHTGGSANVAIGSYAGYYETGSNKLYIDNSSRGNQQNAMSMGLIYGEFNADPAFQKLVINGNVGIGTVYPTHKLSVNGAIRAKEVVVNTGWSDFVFESDYNLMPLYNLEKYILQNKHLPDIPDAAEVDKNGVSLGEMDSKLLQKIEELSLYVIALNKKVDNLQSENKTLKEQIKKVVKEHYIQEK